MPLDVDWMSLKTHISSDSSEIFYSDVRETGYCFPIVS